MTAVPEVLCGEHLRQMVAANAKGPSKPPRALKSSVLLLSDCSLTINPAEVLAKRRCTLLHSFTQHPTVLCMNLPGMPMVFRLGEALLNSESNSREESGGFLD